MQTGEVGIEITPIMASSSLESRFAPLGEDSSQARKYFSLSEKYAGFRDSRVDPKGIGLHGMTIAPGLLRLSDKSGGREFNESDESNIHELAALIGETRDALRMAARQPE